VLLAAEASDPAVSVTGAMIRTLIAAGPVGLFFAATLFKKGVMTVSEHETAKHAWEREREGWARERGALERDVEELKGTLREANAVYTQQVIPTLTRVLDAERELVDLRREEQAERRRRSE
jgi:hypothetical protein